MGSANSTEEETTEIVEVMKKVNINRYMGLWFEVARYKVFYEIGCINTTAEYSLNKDKTVKVINSCNRFGITQTTAEGIGRFRDPYVNNGELEVRFDKDNWGQYNILWTDYENIAFVAGKDYNAFWILTRDNIYSDNHKRSICESLDKLISIHGKNNIVKRKLVWNNGEKLC